MALGSSHSSVDLLGLPVQIQDQEGNIQADLHLHIRVLLIIPRDQIKRPRQVKKLVTWCEI